MLSVKAIASINLSKFNSMKILFVINELSYFLAHRERLAKDALANGHEVMVASGDCYIADIEKLHPKIELIKLSLDKFSTRANHPIRNQDNDVTEHATTKTKQSRKLNTKIQTDKIPPKITQKCDIKINT